MTPREVAAGYPELTVDDFHVDTMAADLVRRVGDFDVILTENMMGDILSDLTAELAGSLGVAPSINASASVVMAQAAHGSDPDVARRGIANPVGMVLSAAMLLTWLSRRHGDDTAAAAAIELGVRETVAAVWRHRISAGRRRQRSSPRPSPRHCGVPSPQPERAGAAREPGTWRPGQGRIARITRSRRREDPA